MGEWTLWVRGFFLLSSFSFSSLSETFLDSTTIPRFPRSPHQPPLLPPFFRPSPFPLGVLSSLLLFLSCF